MSHPEEDRADFLLEIAPTDAGEPKPEPDEDEPEGPEDKKGGKKRGEWPADALTNRQRHHHRWVTTAVKYGTADDFVRRNAVRRGM
ncbi:MAG: hypothetical protein R3F11_21935 [Verrucomicrobiales bacterium]